jgi:hypothetical protein
MGRSHMKSNSDASGGLVLCIVVGLVAFSLGLLSPPGARAAWPQEPIKTQARLLSDGTNADAGPNSGRWVGLSDPSPGQTALPQISRLGGTASAWTDASGHASKRSAALP